MPHDVFISYSSHDIAVAKATCAALEAQRIRCWIAPRDVLAGTEYAKEIVEAINGSRVMVLVFSANANTSPDIGSEVHLAFSRSIPIVSLRIENVVPEGAMEYRLSKTHWLDALTPPLERRIDELTESVSRLLGSGKRANYSQPPSKEAPATVSATNVGASSTEALPVHAARATPESLAERSLRGPSIWLRVIGGVFLAVAALAVIGMAEDIRKSGFTEEGSIAGSIMVLLTILSDAIALWAGFNMARKRRYRLCVIGGFLLAPGTCFIGTPVSIWVIRVLMKPGVRSAFGQPERVQPFAAQPISKRVRTAIYICSGLQLAIIVLSIIRQATSFSAEQSANLGTPGVTGMVLGLVLLLVPSVLGFFAPKQARFLGVAAVSNACLAVLYLVLAIFSVCTRQWLVVAIFAPMVVLFAVPAVLLTLTNRKGIRTPRQDSHEVPAFVNTTAASAQECGTAPIAASEAEKQDSTKVSPRGIPAYSGPRVGRHDPCPCGSGKKFKFCCGL